MSNEQKQNILANINTKKKTLIEETNESAAKKIVTQTDKLHHKEMITSSYMINKRVFNEFKKISRENGRFLQDAINSAMTLFFSREDLPSELEYTTPADEESKSHTFRLTPENKQKLESFANNNNLQLSATLESILISYIVQHREKMKQTQQVKLF